jgi:hypothetical protein
MGQESADANAAVALFTLLLVRVRERARVCAVCTAHSDDDACDDRRVRSSSTRSNDVLKHCWRVAMSAGLN